MNKPVQLKQGYSYYCNFVKFPQDRFTSFSVGVKQQDNTYQNYQIFSFGKHDIKDGDKIKIDKIISVEQSEYNGKQQFKLTCEISLDDFEYANKNNQQEYQASEKVNDKPLLDHANMEDLPF